MSPEEHARLSSLAGSWEILSASPSVHTFGRAAYKCAAGELRRAIADFAAPPPVEVLRRELEAR